MSRTTTRRLTWLALLLAGCSGAAGPRPFPVSGQVRYRGKPLPGAVLAFHPLDGQPGARLLSTVTDEQGRFQLTLRKAGDGAPAGKYAVTAVWREQRRDGDERLRNGRNLLQERYAQPQTSGLTATVLEGPNELPPFELTDR